MLLDRHAPSVFGIPGPPHIGVVEWPRRSGRNRAGTTGEIFRRVHGGGAIRVNGQAPGGRQTRIVDDIDIREIDAAIGREQETVGYGVIRRHQIQRGESLGADQHCFAGGIARQICGECKLIVLRALRTGQTLPRQKLLAARQSGELNELDTAVRV